MGQNILSVYLVVEQVETVVRLALRLLVQLSLKHPDLYWCLQAHRQSPLLSFFQSTSEVRALPSTGITRLPRYLWPSPTSAVGRHPSDGVGSLIAPPPATDLPQLPRSSSRHAVPSTPVDRTGALSVSSPFARPSPVNRRVGIHDFTFEACSGFT